MCRWRRSRPAHRHLRWPRGLSGRIGYRIFLDGFSISKRKDDDSAVQSVQPAYVHRALCCRSPRSGTEERYTRRAGSCFDGREQRILFSFPNLNQVLMPYSILLAEQTNLYMCFFLITSCNSVTKITKCLAQSLSKSGLRLLLMKRRRVYDTRSSTALWPPSPLFARLASESSS